MFAKSGLKVNEWSLRAIGWQFRDVVLAHYKRFICLGRPEYLVLILCAQFQAELYSMFIRN
jgi:hypothetical protein